MSATYDKKSFKSIQRTTEQVAGRHPRWSNVDGGGRATGAKPTIASGKVTETVYYQNSDKNITQKKVPS